jgi:outer membrane protein assembly factor BamE (lipoprotein component of BamABCDE complex)
MDRPNSRPARRRALIPALLIAGLAVSACEPVRQTHGYVPADAYVKRIKVGEDSRGDIVSKIGRPSTTGTFEADEEWYYISRSTETRAFFAPKATEQKVMVLSFDADGVVSGVDRYSLEDGQVIDLVTRTTPTRGKRLTFLQQLLGNIGKFSPAQILGEESIF